MARRGVALGAAVFAISASARADPVHHNEVLVGGRALGMGGAATGLAEDAASVYYNPAGIAQMGGSSLSASFQVQALQKITVDHGLQAAGLADLKHDEKPSLAVYVSAIAKFGEADGSGFRRHAVAFSTVNPEQEQLAFGGFAHIDESYADLKLDTSDETVWRGLSYAYSLSSRWAFGLSAFWSHRELKHREAWIFADGVRSRDYVDSQGSDRNAILADQIRADLRDVKLNADAAVLRLGVRHDLSPSWRLGVMLQPPGIPIGASASVAQERITFGADEPDAPAPTYFRSQKPASAHSPIPWELRLGGAYLHDDFTLALDVLLHGPTGSAQHPVVAVGAPASDDAFGRPPAMPFLLPTSYYTHFVTNVAIGVEGMIGSVVPWATGVFTDFSAAPSIHGPSDAYAWPDVDRFGVTASVGFRQKSYNLQIGGALVLGSGDALVVNSEADASTYTKSHWQERTFMFFLSGYQRALEDVGKSVVDSVLK